MTTNYPHAPGFKAHDTETSRQAAEKVESAAGKLRKNILAAYRGADMTADACAELLRPQDMSDVAFETFKRSVRSRCSELKAQGEIEPSPAREKNESGHSAVVWRLARKGPLTQGELI